MERRIEPGDMFKLKKGMKIRMKDGKLVELLSDYIAEGLKYEYSADGEAGEMSCINFVGGYITGQEVE